jgi:hypothetical protein
MPLIERIRALINSYLADQITVSGFRDRFMSLFLESDQSDAGTEQLAIDVESAYGEFAAHLIEEPELKNRLASIATPSISLKMNKSAFLIEQTTTLRFLAFSYASNSPTVTTPTGLDSTGSLPNVKLPEITLLHSS